MSRNIEPGWKPSHILFFVSGICGISAIALALDFKPSDVLKLISALTFLTVAGLLIRRRKMK